MQPGRVPARGPAHQRRERRPERQMPARAVPGRTHDRATRTEPGHGGRDVLVELRRRQRLDVGLPARLALVVEAEHRPGRLDAVIDLRRRDHEPVAREPRRPAHRRLGQLEDVGVEEDPRPVAGSGGRGDERPHRPLPDSDVDEFTCDDHDPASCHAGAHHGLPRPADRPLPRRGRRVRLPWRDPLPRSRPQGGQRRRPRRAHRLRLADAPARHPPGHPRRGPRPVADALRARGATRRRGLRRGAFLVSDQRRHAGQPRAVPRARPARRARRRAAKRARVRDRRPGALRRPADLGRPRVRAGPRHGPRRHAGVARQGRSKPPPAPGPRSSSPPPTTAWRPT